MIKRFFYSASALLPFRWLTRCGGFRLIAPFYHLVSDDCPAHIKYLYPVVSPHDFAKDLDFLLKHYIPISAAEVPLVISGQKHLPKPALFLSFDDGFREVAQVIAPILLEKGMPATFFVTPAFVDNVDMLYRCKQSLIAHSVMQAGDAFVAPDFTVTLWGERAHGAKYFAEQLFKLGAHEVSTIEGIAHALGVDLKGYLQSVRPYLTLDELQSLAQKGFTIGAHSYSHPLFANLPVESQIAEVEQSLEWVERNIPNQPRMFAFPFTDYGVAAGFYRHFLRDNPQSFDVMFGTAGLKLMPSPAIVQRIPMEVKRYGARQILGGEYLYYAAKRIVGKHKMSIPQ